VQVVADPNVLVSAVVTPAGVCAELLIRLAASPIRLVVSPLLLAEVRRVLERPRFAAITTEQRARYLGYLASIAVGAEDPAPTGEPLVESDPGDDYLLRLVLGDPSRILVTGDSHLLDLAGTYPIVSPRSLLERLPG
jgi:putative PIN family toxin of toxin-antitoxin system